MDVMEKGDLLGHRLDEVTGITMEDFFGKHNL